jgi:Cu/Ag efflux protein CusF
MQHVGRMSKGIAAAAFFVGVSSVTALSLAQQEQGSPDDHGSQGQGSGSQNQGSQKSQERGTQDQGSQDQGANAAPTTAEAQMTTTTATIQKIDKSSRAVTLKDPQGGSFDVKAAPDVKLEQLHAGDQVSATYYAEVAVGISKAGQEAPKMAQKTVQRGGVTARQSTVTARIVSVNPSHNEVVVRGPQGKMHTLKVQDPDLQAQLKNVKPGDNVSVTYTQAVALTIGPMAK